MNNKQKVVFFGSPEFALPTLTCLDKDKKIEIAAVVTQPDRPKNRGKKLSPTPVKKLARNLGLPVFEAEKLDQQFATDFKKLNPDLAVVSAYGKIIPKSILKILPGRFINIHPSLLPKYRGASPIQAAILNGDSQTGVTIMLLNEGLDTGDILSQKRMAIPKAATAGSLHDQLAKTGADLLLETIPDYLSGRITPKKQDNQRASFTKQISKDDGRIIWPAPALKIERQIRAMTPWPAAWTKFNQISIKISQAETRLDSRPEPPGTVVEINKNLGIVCGQGIIIVKKIQRQGKDWTSGSEFLRGFKQILGQRLT